MRGEILRDRYFLFAFSVASVGTHVFTRHTHWILRIIVYIEYIMEENIMKAQAHTHAHFSINNPLLRVRLEKQTLPKNIHFWQTTRTKLLQCFDHFCKTPLLLKVPLFLPTVIMQTKWWNYIKNHPVRYEKKKKIT